MSIPLFRQIQYIKSVIYGNYQLDFEFDKIQIHKDILKSLQILQRSYKSQDVDSFIIEIPAKEYNMYLKFKEYQEFLRMKENNANNTNKY